MGRKLDNVVSLYLTGVVDGHVLPAADKYLTESYVDHLAGGGRDAFVAGFQPLVARYDDRAVWPLRGFEDGSKVFLHSYQSFGRGQVHRVRVDVFDTDDEDNLTEGWSVTVPLRVAPSGHSPIDGTTIVDPSAPTEQSKKIVRGYVTDVLVDARGERLGAYLHPEFVEHGAVARGGLTDPSRRLEAAARVGMPDRWRGLAMVIGHGDFVTTLSSDPAGPVFDIFRVEGGLIVEHWDTR